MICRTPCREAVLPEVGRTDHIGLHQPVPGSFLGLACQMNNGVDIFTKSHGKIEVRQITDETFDIVGHRLRERFDIGQSARFRLFGGTIWAIVLPILPCCTRQ